ncbi:DUF302 domain-containing protein [Geobacter argillaceus]|uniref:Uncharacterized protein (DUF302 family) n=1 Tax=Geobacter argillaceus TaxID=345631 RepID=A0A562VFM6_9BACT|nr:DUF302 domain-containing protein [Geobacter argillaceus]TWJ16682.1 uncharacterized protein (DUF302 family) [Geobacter argillaceus]
MNLQKNYAFGKAVQTTFAETEARVREELLKEGFGILTEIDVASKFREKLGKDFRKYLILGACNPALAWEAFGRELDIGTLLPCNVVVYEGDDAQTVVMIMDPVAALSLIGNPEVEELALLVKQKMERVLSAL